MANINTQNVSKAEEALMLAKNDMIAFGKLFLPEDFMRSETPFFHYEVADCISDKSIRQMAVILPRGHGKTVLTKCNILNDFLFAEEPLFYGWVAASSKISVPNLDYIKYHLEYNDKASLADSMEVRGSMMMIPVLLSIIVIFARSKPLT